MKEKKILTETLEQTTILFGPFDANVAAVEKAFDVTVSAKDTTESGGNAILIRGEDTAVESAAQALDCML